MSNFEQGMHKNDANFVPLTPISFLDRIKDVYPDYEALVYKERKYSWRQVYDLSLIHISEPTRHAEIS